MNLSIFGLGYVGAVSSACFSAAGYRVVGIDVSSDKIDSINKGLAPIVETGLDALIKEARESGRLSATTDIESAVLKTDISIICVGTPSQVNGDIDLSYIYRVIEEIATVLRLKDAYHTVVIRSTVSPGTVKICEQIICDISKKELGKDFGVVSNPEFLREGTAIADFYSPPYTIIGTRQEKSELAIRQLYSAIDAPIYCLKPEESELIKYANNNFHAMKITFANEIGNICKALGVDGHAVMDIVAEDKKLNLSPYYLKPGFAYGGSCLPKDVRALTYKSKSLDIDTPLLNSLNASNELQIQRALELVINTGKNKIGVLGFAFKGNTDDLRESPVVSVIEALVGKGFSLSIYDKNVMLSSLTGKNKNFIMNSIPHIQRLMKDTVSEVVDNSEVIIIGNIDEAFKSICDGGCVDKVIIDLVRIDSKKLSEGSYVGICW